ncbi:hypothetical protein FJU30_18225 [Affinibrenneria salicis]|uniref:Uncharacterized protein n=1 Tax=Affinibrenneria salicis TaxID=2590031 RepID=A0A5J5FVQ1_9GAMM|nr:hypothetical protein [Affinibrenneria salicis]KAA8997697.1 hypothetical protein FJU30_18225 [Affinibrenneria salicis]
MEHDFNEDSFHDNLIHGVVFYSDVGEFSSDIALDIDYIEKWIKTERGEIFFVIYKALLKFHDVTDLKLSINWGDTNNSHFSGDASGVYINKITKKRIYSPIEDDYFLWNIDTNNHDSHINFGASSFSLEIIGSKQTVNRQFLLRNER